MEIKVIKPVSIDFYSRKLLLKKWETKERRTQRGKHSHKNILFKFPGETTFGFESGFKQGSSTMALMISGAG